jgi:hypothetical protein
MPWVMKSGALRSIRKAKELDRRDAAKLVGLGEQTIHRHETKGLAPRTLQAETVKRYAKGYGVEKEEFARWSDHEEEATVRKKRHSPVKDPAAPPVATLTQRAKLELALKAQKRVDIAGQSVEVVGNAIIRECMNAFVLYEGKRFIVEGTIDDTDYIPRPAVAVLGCKYGASARYRIGREVVEGLPVYVTVFAPEASQVLHLNECSRSDQRVSLLVRVMVKPAEGDWEGFLIFEKSPKYRPWCFVVEQVLPSTSTST